MALRGHVTALDLSAPSGKPDPQPSGSDFRFIHDRVARAADRKFGERHGCSVPVSRCDVESDEPAENPVDAGSLRRT
jgi:hypothetical protein